MCDPFRVFLKPYLPACPHRDSRRKLAGGVCLTRRFLSPWARVGVFKTTSSSWGCRCFFLFLHSVSFSEALELTTSESDSPTLCRTLGSGHFEKPGLGRMQTAAASGQRQQKPRPARHRRRGSDAELGARREGRRGRPQMSPVETSTRHAHSKGKPSVWLSANAATCLTPSLHVLSFRFDGIARGNVL